MLRVKVQSNRRAMLSAAQRASARVLRRFGAYVRTTASRSIRKKKRESQPGEPPRSVLGTLKRFTLFDYDPAEQSVVIGAALLPGKKDAAEVLEHGGRTTRTITRWRGRARKRETVAAKYEPRPFVRPALEKRLPELPQLWKDAFKG